MKRTLVFISSLIILGVCVYFIVAVAPQFLANINSKSGLDKIPLAPDFTVNDLSGKKVHLVDLRGKKVILFFWTTWNNVSLEQMKMVHDYTAHYAGKDLLVLAVNSQEGADVVKKAALGDNASFSTLLDTDGEVGTAYSIGVVPLYVFVDSAGLSVNRVTGPLSAKTFEDLVVAFSK